MVDMMNSCTKASGCFIASLERILLAILRRSVLSSEVAGGVASEHFRLFARLSFCIVQRHCPISERQARGLVDVCAIAVYVNCR